MVSRRSFMAMTVMCTVFGLIALFLMCRQSIDLGQYSAQDNTGQIRERHLTMAPRLVVMNDSDGYRRKYVAEIPHMVAINPGSYISYDGSKGHAPHSSFVVKIKYQVVARKVKSEFPGAPAKLRWELDSVHVFIDQGDSL